MLLLLLLVINTYKENNNYSLESIIEGKICSHSRFYTDLNSATHLPTS